MCSDQPNFALAEPVITSLDSGAGPSSKLAQFSEDPSPSTPPGMIPSAAKGVHRFIFELGTAAPSIAVKNDDTGETLIRLDKRAIDQLVPPTGDENEDAFDLAELLRSLERSVGRGLPKPLGRVESRGPNRQPARFLEPAKTTGRKLWDLPHQLHCPIIGTCLDAADLHKLARKVEREYAGTESDYDVHVRFVAAADAKNALSLATHKALEKKHAAYVRRFAKAKTPEQVAGLWDDALARGEVPGGFWATLTHPKCDDALRAHAYEEVHMLSHQIGAGQRADLKRLSETQSELYQLKRDFDSLHMRTSRQMEEREQRILELESDLRKSETERRRFAAQVERLDRQLARLRISHTHDKVVNLEKKSERQNRHLRLVERERDSLRQACEDSQARAATLQADYDEKLSECAALERLIAQSLACDICEEDRCNECPDLDGRLILCVGGRAQLIDQYRALVARCNGRFDHHDGGLEDNRQRLQSMLSSANAVVCVTDCVSHNASDRLKRFCKQHEKPYVFLRSSGISTFARALETVAK